MDLVRLGSGTGPSSKFGTEAVIDSQRGALRVSLSPYDYSDVSGNVFGHYRVSGATSAIAPAGNGILFAMRWTDPTRVAVLMRLAASISVITAVTAQRTDPLVATVQRAYTAAETTNATSILPTANTGKARVNMGTTLLTNLQVASAAAGLTGGTKTADGQPFSHLPVTSIVAIGSGQVMDDFYRFDQAGSHPIVLSVNEGITVAWGATTLATGTVTVNFAVSWAELAQF